MFACGLFNTPLWAPALVAFAMLAYWSWTRRVQLNAMRRDRWLRTSLISVAVIIGVLASAYALGRLLGGWI